MCCWFGLPGLDWYESGKKCKLERTRYCHVPPYEYQTTTTTTTKRPPCFPSTAKVNLQTGKTVAMSELQIGDSVQTGMNELNFTY